MDTNAPTPKAKSRKLPTKKLLLIILIVALVGGAVGAYYYRQRPEDTASDDSTQQTDTEEGQPVEEVNVEDLADRYAFELKQLEDIDEKSDFEKITLYTGLAYDGAALDKPEAKQYAEEALKLAPEDDDSEAATAIRMVLLEVSHGNYTTAKAIVLGTTEE